MTTPDIAQQIVDANRAGAKPGSPVIGLVLGSGAARGFAHIGVMRALDAHGIKPDIIVGTSMGALVGGCYATGQLDTLEAWARSLTVRRVFGYLDVKFGGSGLISGNRLARQLEESVGTKNIEDLPIRFAAIATEVGTGHEVWLTHGSLALTLRASYALPGIFPPCIWAAAGWSTAHSSIRCRCRRRAPSVRGSSSPSTWTPTGSAAAPLSRVTARIRATRNL